MKGVGGSWHATDADIELLESDLARISNLRSVGESKGIRINQPDRFFRQHTPVVIENRIS